MSVIASPADNDTITCPVFCCVPAPDPYTLSARGAPFLANANWLGSTPDTEYTISYIPAATTTEAAFPGVCVIPDRGPLLLNKIGASNATTYADVLYT
jgi:hypothetical protein